MYLSTCCKAADEAALRRESEKENPLSQCLHKNPPIAILPSIMSKFGNFFQHGGNSTPDSLAATECLSGLDWRRQVLVDSTLPEAYRIEGVVGKMSFPRIGEICSFPGMVSLSIPFWRWFLKYLGIFCTLQNFGKWYVNDLSFDEGAYFVQGGTGKTTTYSHFIATFYWSNMLGRTLWDKHNLKTPFCLTWLYPVQLFTTSIADEKNNHL